MVASLCCCDCCIPELLSKIPIGMTYLTQSSFISAIASNGQHVGQFTFGYYDFKIKYKLVYDDGTISYISEPHSPVSLDLARLRKSHSSLFFDGFNMEDLANLFLSFSPPFSGFLEHPNRIIIGDFPNYLVLPNSDIYKFYLLSNIVEVLY